jgi:hypothetical protein
VHGEPRIKPQVILGSSSENSKLDFLLAHFRQMKRRLTFFLSLLGEFPVADPTEDLPW